MEETLSDILETCLMWIESGASVEGCLTAFPQHRAALEAPLRAAEQVRLLPRPVAPQAALASIESQLLARAALRRTGHNVMPLQQPTSSSASAPTPQRLDPAAMLAGILRSLGYQGPLSQPWLRGAAIALALIMALILGTGAYAAARAIVNLVAPQQAAQQRPTSAAALPFTHSGTIEQIGEREWIVGGLRIALDAQTEIAGAPTSGAIARISGVIQDDGTLLARTITVEAPAPTPTSTALPTTAPTLPPTALPPTTLPATTLPEVAPTVATVEAPIVIAPGAPSPTPPPEAQPAPPAPSEPFAELRAIIEAGIADGRAGKRGDDLRKHLDDAQQQVAAGDGRKGADRLRDMRNYVQDWANKGEINPDFAQQVVSGIDAVAAFYSLDLSDPKPDNPGNGDGNPGNPGNPGNGGGGDDDDDDGGGGGGDDGGDDDDGGGGDD
jgi:hypothetical protein